MVAAGRRLEDEFPSIYWSSCVAHCLNLILDWEKEEVVSCVCSRERSKQKRKLPGTTGQIQWSKKAICTCELMVQEVTKKRKKRISI
jgi:hypothetical protein